ncbi:lamin tail domain-containing protein [Streptomyces sp. NBC_01498]|uniref:lamin tail domain-containing protein n=1 Tax=Streptomyces sp. NBC_01498 TaxID=2975870 RepID=UPI002E7B5202|nr:lamin tail domain-containing protein [Streptomyces sp. NBC_01498]WTL25965.1 lamin tail domain-containing protein [Streptomyces sp. NBC_01498]
MRYSRTLSTVVASAAVVTGTVLLPAQAQAAGSVHLYKVYYDSPGTDSRSNASLNGEYIQIRNTTTSTVSLTGWTVTDSANHRYTFGSYSLGRGKTVTVRTGSGTNSATTRYQGRGAYVWNNDRDVATLKKSTGTQVDTCSYNSTRVDYKMC